MPSANDQPGAEPRTGGWNGYAITSLVAGVFGVACFLWAVGLGFGIAALRAIPRRGQRGRGLAVAGIALSGLWALLLAVGVGLGLAGYSVVPLLTGGTAPPVPPSTERAAVPSGAAGHPAAPSGTLSVFGLRTGDCFETLDASNRTTVRPVPCAQPHVGEVFAVATADDSFYPGPYPPQREATAACEPRRNDYAMDTWAVPRSVRVHEYLPDARAWDGSGHRIVCWLADDNGEQTGSLRRDGTNLTAEQVAYLRVADRVEGELAAPPGKMAPNAEPTIARPWEYRLSSALDTELTALDSTPWSDQVRQPAADLKAELARMLPALAALRTAPDGTSAQQYVTEVRSHGARAQAAAVRAALGLATE